MSRRCSVFFFSAFLLTIGGYLHGQTKGADFSSDNSERKTLYTARADGAAAHQTQESGIGGSAGYPAQETQADDRRVRGEVLTASECALLHEALYRTGSIPVERIIRSMEYIQKKRADIHAAGSPRQHTAEEQQLAESYLMQAKILSDAYNYGAFKNRKKLRTIHAETERIKAAVPLSSRMVLYYANYRYTKLVLPKETFRTAAALPVLYRKALLLDRSNREAAIKLACWHIFAANETTGNYNSFIESQEEFLDTLTPVDRFTAYILYSSYYMKKYQTEKAAAYIAQASALFPNHVLLLHLLENYRQGHFAL